MNKMNKNMNEKRKDEIALALLKSNLLDRKDTWLSLDMKSIERELGNIAKAIGIPLQKFY